jgi:hypothetical protein
MDPTPHDIRRATGGNAENASAEGNRRGAPRHYKRECLKRKGTFAEGKDMFCEARGGTSQSWQARDRRNQSNLINQRDQSKSDKSEESE